MKTFASENDEFRVFMAENPDHVVAVRNFDGNGGCIVCTQEELDAMNAQVESP